MSNQQLRRRTNPSPSNSVQSSQPASGQTENNGVKLPNPLTLQAVSSIFQRRWAVPLTVAAGCLFLHAYSLFFESPDSSAPSDNIFSLREKIAVPLVYSKYGAGAGAVFGIVMWVLVVTLTEDSEGKSSKSEHWAQNNSVLFLVLVGLGMATGAILAFTAIAVMDILKTVGN